MKAEAIYGKKGYKADDNFSGKMPGIRYNAAFSQTNIFPPEPGCEPGFHRSYGYLP